MSRTLDLPDNLYEKLHTQAVAPGFATIPDLLANSSLEPRMKSHAFDSLIDRIDRRRKRVLAEQGTLSDCVPLIREDRDQ